MHTKEALGQAYNRAAVDYDRIAGAVYLNTFWSLVPHINVAPFPSILDVGCGTGINLLEASRALGPCRDLVGVDLSTGMLQAARRKAAAMGVNARFMRGDAEALELPEDTFDLSVCNSVFHWFPDPGRAVREMARVLRPGGQLLLATLAEPGYEEWVAVLNQVWFSLFGHPCTSFPGLPTPVDVTNHVRDAGLSIEHLQYRITPAVVNDVSAFVRTMAVVAPVWLEGDPGQLFAELRQAMTAGGKKFVCTLAGVEVVARKGVDGPRI